MSVQEMIHLELPKLTAQQQELVLAYLRNLTIQKSNQLTQDSLQKAKPAFGCGKWPVTLKPDFDHPIEDFNEYTL